MIVNGCMFQGTSQTMSTLRNLVHKGVKVDLGVPYELWDEPTVEVADMKRQVTLQLLKNSRGILDDCVCCVFSILYLYGKVQDTG